MHACLERRDDGLGQLLRRKAGASLACSVLAIHAARDGFLFDLQCVGS